MLFGSHIAPPPSSTYSLFFCLSLLFRDLNTTNCSHYVSLADTVLWALFWYCSFKPDLAITQQSVPLCLWSIHLPLFPSLPWPHPLLLPPSIHLPALLSLVFHMSQRRCNDCFKQVVCMHGGSLNYTNVCVCELLCCPLCVCVWYEAVLPFSYYQVPKWWVCTARNSHSQVCWVVLLSSQVLYQEFNQSLWLMGT